MLGKRSDNPEVSAIQIASPHDYNAGQSACDTEYSCTRWRISDLARNRVLTKVAIAIVLASPLATPSTVTFPGA